VASLAGNQFSIVSGGAVCVAGALALALALPAFARHRASDVAGATASEPLDIGPIAAKS
jgi:hypothetical protein